jgi:uncharacterized phage protein (predicted DNA packaging)
MQMKISEITVGDVKKALRIDYSHDDSRIENEIMPAVLSRLIALTNRTAEDLDNFPELVTAYMCLANDYYDGTTEREEAARAICHGVQLNLVG